MPNEITKPMSDKWTSALRKALVEIGALIPVTPEEVKLAEARLTDGTTPEEVEASFKRLEEILDDHVLPQFMQLHESIQLPSEDCVSMVARNAATLKAEAVARIAHAVASATAEARRKKPKLSQAREVEILELSEDMANEDCVSGRVCPARICTAKEIKVLHDSFGAESFDGMLVYEKSRWVILCNRDTGNVHGSARERFTLAHELGHFHIPEHRRQLMAGHPPHGSHAGAFDNAETSEELEADTFAANLLMPPVRFVPRLRALNKPPLQAITGLRKEFDTSLESTAIQTMRHDCRVVAIAKWLDVGLAWHRISESFFRETGFRQFRLQSNSLPNDCATAIALADSELQFDAPVRDAVVTAAFCFGHVATGSQRDILLREEAVRNGRFGVISVYSTLNERETKTSRRLSRV
jgi:Zn-dependent peptidase ImmA (M78 family)